MKKKFLVLGTAMLAAVAITACGGKDTTATTATTAETTAESPTMPEAQTTEGGTQADSQTGQGSDAQLQETAQDVTADASQEGPQLEAGEIGPFAEKVQKAVADKDIEALAGLCAYPVYVSMGEGEGEEIADEKAFVALDGSKLFTEGLLKEIADTDVNTLEQFGAGVIMGNENSIIFNKMDGKAGITAISLQ